MTTVLIGIAALTVGFIGGFVFAIKHNGVFAETILYLYDFIEEAENLCNDTRADTKQNLLELKAAIKKFVERVEKLKL